MTDICDFSVYNGRGNPDLQENINKVVVSIYNSLHSLAKLAANHCSNTEEEIRSEKKIITAKDFCWKVKKIMLLLHEKMPKLR